MKKLLLSSAAVLGLTASAMAADLPRRAAPPVYAPAIPVFTWTGFYVGANAGYAWADNNRDGTIFVPAGTLAPSIPAAGTVVNNFGFGNDGNDDGFTIGGTAGFNYQMGAIVLGVEGDLNWADIGSNNNNNAFGVGFGNTVTFVPPGGAAGTYTFVGANRGGFDWFGTVRGRVGVAFDRALVYATGGFAFANGNDGNSGFCGGAFFAGCGNNDDWRSGWTVGGGVEYAFTNTLTAKIEGLWVSLDEGNRGGGLVAIPAAGNPNPPVLLATGNRNDNDFFVARVGLNYKFGM
jgi:outer membrane immunogenic protein